MAPNFPPTMPGGMKNIAKYGSTLTKGDFSVLYNEGKEIGSKAGIVTAPIPVTPVHLPMQPEYIWEVFLNKSRRFKSGFLKRMIAGDYLGNHLLVMAEDEEVKPQRQAVNNSTHAKALHGFVGGMQELIVNAFESHVGATVNLTPFMKQLHLQLNGFMFFSQDLGELTHLIPEFFTVASIQRLGPGKYFKRKEYSDYLTRKAKVMELIYSIIDTRRKMANPPFDMLQALLSDEGLQAQMDSGALDDLWLNGRLRRAFMSPRERQRANDRIIAKMILQLFIGGSDTGSTGTTMIPLHLAHKPDLLKRLREELDSVLGDELPDHATWDKAHFLRAIMLEDWRRNMPATILRQASWLGAKIGPYNIQPGSLIVIESWSLHNDPKFWTNPDDFNPNRFIEGHAEEAHPPKGVYAAFGGGPRPCLGMFSARQSGAMINGTSAKNYDLNFVRDDHGNLPEQKTKIVVTREPDGELPTEISHRSR
jgi:cytochrome P450